MIYLLAFLAAVTLVVLFWKGFGPQRTAAPRSFQAPDDDPDFLRGLDRRRPERDGDDPAP